jgi:hypothetical protein
MVANLTRSARLKGGLASAFVAVTLGASSVANATVIVGVEPSKDRVNVSETLTADVLARADDSIGSYEVDLDFDGDVLDVASIDFSGNFGVSRTGSTLNTGSVNATETTLELPSTLERKQPDDVFSLFTVAFTAAAVGETVLGGEFQALDPFGRVSGDGRFSDRELPGGGLSDARVKVTDGDEPTSVPAPSSIWLLAIGLIGFLRRRN